MTEIVGGGVIFFQEIFESIDTDKSGSISFDEFLTVLARMFSNPEYTPETKNIEP